MKYNKPKIIAEIGCNHKGDLDIEAPQREKLKWKER